MKARDRLRAVLRRLNAFTRALRELFPFTPLGVLVTSACSLSLWRYGVLRADLLLLVLGSVGVAIGLLTMLSSMAAALLLRARVRRAPEGEALRFECGFAVRTGFSLPSYWFLPFVKVSWQWLTPEADTRQVPLKRRLHEEITPRRRALRDEVLRRFEVSDAFGLTRIRFTLAESRGVQVAPSIGALRNMHVVRSIAGGDNLTHPAGPPEGERADMRPYAPGDPIKFVLWKVFARSRQLVVRTPERAISPVRQTVAYLVTGAHDEPAAGAARIAVESGALGSEWSLGADGQETIARTPQQALELLARSSNTDVNSGGYGLDRYLSSVTPGGPSRAVVFVPARPGPWLERVVAVARARSAGVERGSPIEFVVCTDGVRPAEKRSWVSRLAIEEPRSTERSDATPQDALNAVLAALGAARSRVLVVDRVAGRVFGAEHQRAQEVAA